VAKSSFIGDILHFGATRLRVNGGGNLQQILRSLDNTERFDLPELPMTNLTNREPVRLANFNKQRAQLEIRVLEIDEWFVVSKAIFFITPVATGYPVD
jgi:hypothetical protein